VAHLTPPRSFYVGEEEAKGVRCDYFIPAEKLGTTRAPVVLADASSVYVVVLPRATGWVEIGGQRMSLQEAVAAGRVQPCSELSGAQQIALPANSKARVELDAIVFATGFDAMTGALREIDIRTTDGASLRDHWAGGPLTYLGLMVSGFPNMFVVTGPGSPGVKTQMIASIEQHVDWIADCLDHMRRHACDRIEATAEAESTWVQHVNEVADSTLYPLANSWYVGANIPGKPRVFLPYLGPEGVGGYRKTCDAGFST